MDKACGHRIGALAARIVIERVEAGKKRYLDLLLLADEQEDMVDRYLDSGDMYVALFDGKAVGECVVTDEGEGLLELKSLAVTPLYQGRGLGRLLIESMVERYRGSHSTFQVGTGGVPSTVGFYERCGFVRSHRIKGFFTDNYDHAIFEDGVQLVDMVYLRRPMRPAAAARGSGRRATIGKERVGDGDPSPTLSNRSVCLAR